MLTYPHRGRIMVGIKCPGHLPGKWAVVTGASSGIGKEIALILASLGMNVCITARSEQALLAVKSTIESLQVQCKVFVLDLVSEGASQRLQEWLNLEEITPYVFINNAGRGVYGGFRSMHSEEIAQMLMLNVTTMTLLCRHMAEIMPRDSYMLLVSSTICFQPAPSYAAYAATKSYVHSLGLALNYELKSNIHVCTLYPGITNTKFFEVSHQLIDPLIKKLMMMDAKVVARAGVSALLRKKVSVVSGLRNKVLSAVSKITPNFIALRIFAWLFGK